MTSTGAWRSARAAGNPPKPAPTMTTVGRWGRVGLLKDHRGAVAQHFGRRRLARDLGCVERHPDDGVGTELAGVLDHEVVRRLARLLAHLRVRADAAADDALQAAENALRDRGRAHRDAADDSFVVADAASLHVERRGHDDGGRDGHRTLLNGDELM